MRVLHVIPAVAPRYGGPSRVVPLLAAALGEAGVEAEVATTDADGPGRLAVPLERPVPFEGARVTFFRRDGGERWKRSRGLEAFLRREAGGFDLLHVHAVFSHASLAAGRAALAAGVPFVLRPLGSLAREGLAANRLLKTAYLSLPFRAVLAGAASLHFTSAAEREASAAWAGDRPSFVVPNPVETVPAPAVAADAPPGPYLLQMSRLAPVKRIDALLRSFARVAPRHPGWSLVIAGDGPPGIRAALGALAAPLAGRVRFTGWVEGEERRRLLSGASLLAAVSLHENFCLSAAEAMGCGVPVVVARPVGIAEDVEAAGAGWIAAADLADLDAVLDASMAAAAERAARGARGRDHAAARFSPAAVAGALAERYAALRRRP